MATIQSSIELQDNFSGVLNGIINAVNLSISAFEDMQHTMGTEVDPSSMAAVRTEIDAAAAGLRNMQTAAVDVGQGIDENTTGQEKFNEKLDEGASSANKLATLVKGAIAAYTGVAGIKKAVSWIQDCTDAFDTQLNAENQLMAVLGNTLDADYAAQFEIDVMANTDEAVDQINAVQDAVDTDITVTISAEASTAALESEFDKITAKASEIQSEGIYGDEAMIAGAAELATYFSDVDAITMMMDTLSDYAMGMTGGGEIDSSAMVDYATGLGKVMTGSYDAMTKKGFEFTDAQKAVIEGTATEEEIVATLGEEYLNTSADMQAAAAITQVIDESWAGLYQTMSNTPEGQIIQLKNAFGDLKETVGGQLYPYVMLLIQSIQDNWGTIETVINNVTAGLQVVMGVLSEIMQVAFNVAQVIMDNWSIIAPVLGAIVTLLVAYKTAMFAINTVEKISAGIKGLLAAASAAHSGALAAETAATGAATGAQTALNVALLACPLTWIVVAIIAAIAAIFLVVAAINKAKGTSISAFGVICGGINVVIQFFKNLGLGIADVALGIWDVLCLLGENIKAVFQNAIASVQEWFWNLLSTVLTVVENICAALNKIPFISFDYSGLTDAANDFANKAAEAADSKVEYSTFSDLGDAFSEGFSTFDAFSEGWASDAFDTGYAIGEGVQDSISGNLSDWFDVSDIPSAEDYLTDYTADYSTLSDIADDTSDIASSVSVTDEELKYLRDIAEQETVNRFTTAEVTINQTNNNSVSSKMELDGVISGLSDAMNEAIGSVTEGVHI